jgi:release factor glutamine methyltransferase
LYSIAEKLRHASEILQSSGIIEPRREANSLLTLALQKDKLFLVAHPEYELSFEEENRFQDFLQRRANHEPFQYIAGKQEFYGLDFEVNRNVLIPRPETELIVESAIEILHTKRNSNFCEVGIGSGCIAVSILHQIKTARATGLDVSPKALEIAARNAATHEVSNRLELKISDVFEVLKDENFDLIVSNPPYIPRGDIENLQAEVRDFEPIIALSDGKEGLSIIEKIIAESPKFLNEEGFLLLEIGFGQAEAVREMFEPEIWRAVDIFPDLQGIPRTVRALKVKSEM